MKMSADYNNTSEPADFHIWIMHNRRCKWAKGEKYKNIYTCEYLHVYVRCTKRNCRKSIRVIWLGKFPSDGRMCAHKCIPEPCNYDGPTRDGLRTTIEINHVEIVTLLWMYIMFMRVSFVFSNIRCPIENWQVNTLDV